MLITKRNKALALIIMTTYSSFSFSFDIENILNIEKEKKEYTKDIDALVIGSVNNSYKAAEIKAEIQSKEQILLKDEYYFVPKVTLTSEIKEKMDRPGHPDPEADFNINLSATMKLWSDTVSDENRAAYQDLESSINKYNSVVSNVYRSIANNLVKIENSRDFLSKSRQYKAAMVKIIEKIHKVADSGVLKKSDEIFASVSLKKFEDSILNVESQVESYKNSINNMTSQKLYSDSYGLSDNYVKNEMYVDESMFNIKSVINRNFELISRRAKLNKEKSSVKSYNENFVVQLVTQHNISENGSSNVRGKSGTSYTYDDKGDSYIGLKVAFTGLDFSKYQEKKSQESLLYKKMIELDEFIHQKDVDLQTYKQQYRLLNQRLENIDKQLKLTKNVINSLMKEIMVDESNALDLFRNITSLSDLEMTKLSITNQLADIVNNIKILNSDVPARYVIN